MHHHITDSDRQLTATMESSAFRRTAVIARHLDSSNSTSDKSVSPSSCLQITSPDQIESAQFDTALMRNLLDGHDLEVRDWVFRLMEESELFRFRKLDGRDYVFPDYQAPMEQQREITLQRILYLVSKGVSDGWLSWKGKEGEMRNLAIFDCLGLYDHSLGVKFGVHYFLWGYSVLFLGTKRHHDKWLNDTEKYEIKGSFSMTELGHGSNVRAIETITTYDPQTREFIINTPCESAQKYWIGGAANHATHTVVFSQLLINGENQGVHAFIAQIRNKNGKVCPNVRIADCGHKIGLNGVDNGRIWFDKLRIPRENLLNSLSDVMPDGRFISSIDNPDERFATLLAPLTAGRVNIPSNAVYVSKLGLAIAIRYSLTRRAFSISPGDEETLLLDYPSHQQRLLPLLAKTCAMSFSINRLKAIYVNRTPATTKSIHVYSSALKASITWNNMRILQECRETCGGQGLKTENRVGILKGEYDVQSTFEGDNNVLMQQVSKALLGEYIKTQKLKKPFKGLGLEHMNNHFPIIPVNLTSSIITTSEFQMDLFCLRERDLLTRFASQVSELQAHGESKERAIIQSYQLASELGRAFSEKVILHDILEAERAQPVGSLKDVLSLLRTMYAMVSIEEDASFLRYGYLSQNNAAAIRQEFTKMISKLRPHALAIVKSFGIPDSFLTPLAFDWVEANSWKALYKQK
ncbi:Acyl-CoA oxidase [Zostera marina]|uniref:Acyl-coenzyme A oxidase n=1 Tax=Zostera marina TaxID=29655 RepID=A0A0K9NPK9_ZOSMR|nr:Acyl-CoA oxidase [Zostera marina]